MASNTTATTVMSSTLISLMRKRLILLTTSPISSLQLHTTSTDSAECAADNSQSVLSPSQNLQIHEKCPQSVREFLMSYSFDDTHISKLIHKKPRFLHSSLHDNLKPKLDFLVENGFVGKLLPQLIVFDPRILNRALDSFQAGFEFLKSVLDSDDKIVKAVLRSSWLLASDVKSIMQPNLDFLIKEGVPVDRLEKLIIMHPRIIQLKHDKMVFAVSAVRNLGLEPKAPMFTHALRAMLQMSESTWLKKVEVLKSLGWKEVEILHAFKLCPEVLTCSENKIRAAMDFFVNTVGSRRQTIISNPYFLLYSINRRLRPRYNVLKALQLKKLIDVEKKKIEQLLTAMSEEKFMENYVTKFVDDVPGLLQIYGRSNDKEAKG